MNERDLIATQTIKQVSEGGDAVRADLKATASAQDQLAASSNNLAGATETSARRQTSAAAAFNAMARAMDPAARAFADLERNQATFARTLSQNSSILDKAGQSLDYYKSKLDSAAVAAENLRRQQSNISTNTATPGLTNPTQIIGSQLSNLSAKDSAASFMAAAKAQDEQTASIGRLRAAMNPLEVEQGKLGAETAQYREYLKQGVITQDEFNSHQEMTSKRLGDFAQNLKVAGTAGRVMSGELVNMSYQLNDVVTGLALGQSPFMIMAQQGGQVVQILQNSRASIADFAKSGASAFMSLFTVTRTVFGGIVGAVGLAAYAMYDFAESQRRAGQALIGVGQRTGTTVAQINEFARANASATGLSIDQARDLAIEFTKTGNISIAGLKGLGDAVHGYSILTGQDAKDATKDLAQALGGDLTKAADKLNMTYGFLDKNGRDYVRTLELQGGRTQAIQFIVNEMEKDNKKAADSLGLVAKAWDAVANAASRVKNVIGSANIKDAQLAGGLGGTEGIGLAAPGNQTMPKTAIPDTERLAGVVKELNDWSLAADNVTRATIPQIAQVEALEKAEADLVAQRNARQFLGQKADPQNEAALTAIRNQITASRQLQAESSRYNVRIAEISQSWGNVGQATALSLQTMQNSLPVAQAWTEATRMRAQEQATYDSLIDQGKTSEEAAALSAKQYELSKAAAVASAEKLVQASGDNLDKIRAQGTGMEGVVDSAIAYRDAMQAGATATQAAAISADALAASTLRAAQASQQMQQSAIDAANGTDNGIVTAASMKRWSDAHKNSGKQYTSTSSLGMSILQSHQIAQFAAAPSFSDSIDQSYQNSGLNSALSYAMSQKAGPEQVAQSYTGVGNQPVPYSAYGLSDIVTKPAMSQSDIINQVSTLYGLKNAQTNDPTVQRANLAEEMAWLQTLPETIARDQSIISLQQSIDALKGATDANTAATSATLNPLYSQGHGALAIGYYKAATGLEGVVGGNGGTDSTPVHMMLTPGESIKVTPPGQNDNSKQITNIFNIGGGSNNSRRSRRQALQGFAQSMAAAG